jgi:hypothetical protein
MPGFLPKHLERVFYINACLFVEFCHGGDALGGQIGFVAK